MGNPEYNAQTTAVQHVSLRGKGPARYRIVVRKWLSQIGSDRLAGLEIKQSSEESSQAMTTRLEGIIHDQAQLAGVLNALYDMGFPLLSVEILEE